MGKRDAPHPGSTESEDEEGFYGRWSRRKRRVRDGLDVDGGPSPAGDDEGIGHVATGLADEAPAPLTDADMPPLDSLDENSDFSGFLSPGVSEELRSRALRQLFLSAKFNVVDGLDDYAEDFTRFEPLGDIVTSDMRHQLELAEARAREAAAREDADRLARGEVSQPHAPAGEELAAPSADDASVAADGARAEQASADEAVAEDDGRARADDEEADARGRG